MKYELRKVGVGLDTSGLICQKETRKGLRSYVLTKYAPEQWPDFVAAEIEITPQAIFNVETPLADWMARP